MYINGLVRVLEKKQLEQFQGKEFFLITEFTEGREYQEPYDSGDKGGYISVKCINQYATVDQQVLEAAILHLTERKASFVFCKSNIGSFKINTSVSLLNARTEAW